MDLKLDIPDVAVAWRWLGLAFWFLGLCDLKPTPALADVDPIVKASPYGDKLVWSYHGGDTPLPWSKFTPNTFASIPVPFDATGVRKVGKVPAPGVHPRLFFSPEDLPALRQRLRETRAGQEAWKNVLCYTNTLKLTYNEHEDYAQPDWMDGGFFVHGRCPVYLTHNYDPKRENFYALLAEGKRPEKDYSKFIPLASVEAFRCLVDDDAEAAQTLAKAIITAVKFEQERRQEKDKPVKPGEPPNPSTSRLDAICLGMAYDFIFNWMTPEQRTVVHDELVLLSAWHDNYGSFNNPDNSRSNWASFSYWVFDLLAIEGEPGFNDLKFRGLYRGWRNFITTSYFDSGAIFEGEGKSLLGVDAIAAMDRLAEKYQLQPLSQHPAIRKHYSNFTANSMLPTRQNFAIFDMLGKMGGGLCTPIDVVVAHYLYPGDKKLDFVYRTVVGDDYRYLPNRCDWTWNMVVLSAIFATDYDPENTPEKIELPNSFFCGQRAMLMARSSWDQDATFLTMHVRGASGGHPYRDRNGIMLAAEGRSWVTIPWDGGQDAGWKCNTVIIDGREQSNTTPGRVVDYAESRDASFICGDAKYCWDWVWRNTSRNRDGQPNTRDDVLKGNLDVGPGWTPVEQSFNDFAWTKNPGDVYRQPLKLQPDWLALDGVISSCVKQVNTPVLKAFRTAGVVRGKHPYVLVLDDIQRNSLPARYDWNLHLVEDVVRVKLLPEGADPQDIVLAGEKTLDADGRLINDQPGLLIRLLEAKGDVAAPVLEVREKVNLLTLATRAVSPDFKVLLYAFRAGEPLPATQWSAAHDKLRIEFFDQRDDVHIRAASSGKTDLTIERGGRLIAAVNRAVAPLADPDSELLTKDLQLLPKLVDSLKSFQSEQVPGLVANWTFDVLQDGVFAAAQKDVPAIPAGGAVIESGCVNQAVRVKKDGLVAAIKLKDKIEKNFTVACWVKSDPNPDGSVLDFNIVWGFSLDFVQGSLRFNGQEKWFYGGTHNASMLGDWTHFAVTYDGQSMTVYRDGYVMLTLPAAKVPNFGDKFQLGGSGFNGCFDDLRIYNQALDRETVQKLYWSGRLGQGKS